MAVVHRVTTVSAARQLAEHLLGTDRQVPVVVVTAGAGGGEGLISAQVVADDVGELAEVWWMPTGDPTWEFSAAMPDRTQVFGDAARVYALDPQWKTNPYSSRLHLCATPARAEEVQEDLVADAMAAALDAGLLKKKVAAAQVVTGRVTGFPTPGRALVRGSFGFGMVRAELVPGGVAIERLLAVGTTVSGRYDVRDKLIDVGEMVRSADEALDEYSVGDDVLVRVRTVGSSVVAVEMYPGTIVEIRVAQVTGNDRDDLRDLMSVGEVVVARVERVGSWILSMTHVDDEACPRATSLLEGGPPWLAEQEDATAEIAIDEPESAEPVGTQRPSVEVQTPPVSTPPPASTHAPKPGPQSGEILRLAEAWDREKRTTAALRAENTQTRESLDIADSALRKAETTVEQLRTRVRSLLKKSRGRSADVARPADAAFIDPELQLRHDVYLAWVAKIPAGEKPDKPLVDDWIVGPKFCDSLASMKPEVRDKVPEVVVEILLGIADRSDAREMHPLRTGSGGEAAPRTRDDGATCWRVAVQRNSPSAARLHFWRRSGAPIELSRVVTHDDMQP